jgi:hypothetical protein
MSVATIPDAELIRRAVHSCRDVDLRKGVSHPRWAAVMSTFLLGRTYSRELCERFGFDPDEKVSR